MSKKQIQTAIARELEKLNEKIDIKILEGESYARDARRHKLLLAQLKQLRRREWFSRSMRSLRYVMF